MSQTTVETPRRPATPLGLIGMIALVVLCELSFTSLEKDHITNDAYDWRVGGRAAKARATHAKILCVGDSQLKLGVMPKVLQARLGRPTYNLSLFGGQAPASYFMLRRALEAGARPEAILFDFEPYLTESPIEMNRRNWPELLGYRELFELARDTRDPEFFAAMALGRAMPIFRNRFAIRKNVMVALRGESNNNRRVIESFSRNRLVNRGAVATNRDPSATSVFVAPWVQPREKPWAGDPVNERYVRKFLRLAESRQIPVYCLVMPVHPTIQSQFQANGVGRDLGNLLARYGARFSNLTVIAARDSTCQDSLFCDGVHLNHRGAVAFTNQLAEILRPRIGRHAVADRLVTMPTFQDAPTDIAVEDLNQSTTLVDRSTDSVRLR
jgi:hypothetical protein